MILIWLESISESQSDSWEGFMAITWQRIHLKENEDRERKCMETTEKENGPIQRDKGKEKWGRSCLNKMTTERMSQWSFKHFSSYSPLKIEVLLIPSLTFWLPTAFQI